MEFVGTSETLVSFFQTERFLVTVRSGSRCRYKQDWERCRHNTAVPDRWPVYMKEMHACLRRYVLCSTAGCCWQSSLSFFPPFAEFSLIWVAPRSNSFFVECEAFPPATGFLQLCFSFFYVNVSFTGWIEIAKNCLRITVLSWRFPCCKKHK
jgi:hypothetical protein